MRREETQVSELLDTLRRQAGPDPFELAVILGSGLGRLAKEVASPTCLAYKDFPCFPAPPVEGHGGRLVAGKLAGRRILVFQGRPHLYQGLNAHQTTVTVRIAHALGCRGILLTNAAGGVNRNYRAGDFMLIADHLNLMGDNPLRGVVENPFVDLTHLYRQDFYADLRAFIEGEGGVLHRGVLAALPGPSYETPAEISALGLLGADAVSMSTVPEAIMARYLGLEVAGISLIANPAAGLVGRPLDHQEVLATGAARADLAVRLFLRLIGQWREPLQPSTDG